jgi:predicted cupin superfamily sugar epimerase
MNADEIIRLLDLKPHPEGGYYRETYRSAKLIPGSQPPKAYSTLIYYLLTPGAVSKFHRLIFDEIFHFYQGDPSHWVWLTPGGEMKKTVLGANMGKGEVPQMVIPAGTWFAGRLAPEGRYCLMGTTMAPGFDFSDLQFAARQELLKLYPQAESEILALT